VAVVVEPPRWTLQPIERELALREVSAILDAPARWDGATIVAEPPGPRPRLAAARRRLAFASSVAGGETAEFELEQAVQPGGRKITSHALHGLHPYKGKFYPQLARSLINICRLEPGMRLLDPFAGCGTSVLEAALLGVTGVGVDANPLGTLVSQTKLELLRTPAYRVRHQLSGIRLRRSRRLHPEADYLERWFPPANYRALLSLLDALNRIEDTPARRGGLVALSSVLRAASYQDPKQIRVYRRPADDKIPSLTELFRTAVDELLHGLEGVQQTPEFALARLARSRSRVIPGDARQLERCLSNRLVPFDGVITSPPYAMALPYVDTDRLSLRALGLLEGGQAAAEARLIGHRDITDGARKKLEAQIEAATWVPQQLAALLRDTLSVAASQEAGFRKRRTPALLYRYFRDMRRVLGQLASVICPGAPVVLVIGDNRVAARNGGTTRVPTADILGELAKGQGLDLEDRLEKRLTSFGAKDTVHQRNAMGHEEVLFFRCRA
jgi:site-specific DNA-methyltransferase (cytosine-N4-specific)